MQEPLTIELAVSVEVLPVPKPEATPLQVEDNFLQEEACTYYSFSIMDTPRLQASHDELEVIK
jgi:hypothetical protein